MPIDPSFIDASAGSPSYSGQKLRLGVITPFVAGSSSSLGVRSGVRPTGSGTDLLVQAQASPNMTVKVNPGVIILQGGISTTQGAYTWTLDATKNVTIAAAHATLARTDLIVVRIRDANVDTSGARDGDVIAITGTAGGGVPSLPTDATYQTIAQIAVGAAVSSIVSGNITDKRVFTAGLGGVLLCTSSTEPAANTVMTGQPAHRSDRGLLRYSDGSNWQTVPRKLGGTRWTGGGNLVTGLVGTETVIMTAAAVYLPANSLIQLSAGIRLLASVAADTYVFRIRETNLAGTQRAEYTWTAPTASNGYNQYFISEFETTSEVSAQVFVLTAQRIGGTGSLTMIAGNAINSTHLTAAVVAPAGAVTIQPTP
ncbi:hypothetical protein [Dactylosporangium salmoneum]|uniref:Uncharacterized protein n=1 Tax=Dactylosporangium salmoneum TaxID=53361 RepID=A0ABP5TB69_9ACTN